MAAIPVRIYIFSTFLLLRFVFFFFRSLSLQKILLYFFQWLHVLFYALSHFYYYCFTKRKLPMRVEMSKADTKFVLRLVRQFHISFLSLSLFSFFSLLFERFLIILIATNKKTHIHRLGKEEEKHPIQLCLSKVVKIAHPENYIKLKERTRQFCFDV